MTRRPTLVILFVALLTAATSACAASVGGKASTTGGPKTVTVTVTSSPSTSRTTSTNVAATTTTTSSSTAPTTPAVSFKPFAGDWVGHTRFVTVSKTGRLEEHVGDGCCDPIIDLVLQLSNPHRTGGAWVATTRVVSATPHAGWKQTGRPAPKPGDQGTVTVGADHILVDSITDNGFCDPDKTEPGTCGA